MLTVTPTASAALAALLDSPEVPDGAGVRIARGEGPDGEPGIGLAVVSSPEPSDMIVDDAAGVELYVEPQAAELLDDQELDVETEGGQIGFTLHRRPLNGGPPGPS
jgi:iron-sulfur cluster assembly protein